MTSTLSPLPFGLDRLGLPKTCKFLPKWRNFAKSGHTGCDKKVFSVAPWRTIRTGMWKTLLQSTPLRLSLTSWPMVGRKSQKTWNSKWSFLGGAFFSLRRRRRRDKLFERLSPDWSECCRSKMKVQVLVMWEAHLLFDNGCTVKNVSIKATVTK